MKLYVYDHCPYCVKARMIFGMKQIPFELVTLLNDDEATPMRMIGQKMVPILETPDGQFMPESMDIVRFIDAMDGRPILAPGGDPALTRWLEEARSYVSPLAMPRWVESPLEEFATESAREYFIRKKEAMKGPFATLRARTPELLEQANDHLKQLDGLLQNADTVHEVLSEDDIHLFATLRSLSIVKGMHYSEKLDSYRQSMVAFSGVPLHDAIAK
jgi:glutaredoxin 2